MLEVRDIEVRYGKFLAVHGVSLDVAEGEIVALIGANGAGKSSSMHAICGIEPTSGGEIRFLGEPVTGLPAHQIIRRGIIQVPEGRLIFGGLTIEENLRLGAYSASNRKAARADIERVLTIFPMLKDRLGERGAALSGGQAQMLALARGLMAQPKLLLLDEPSLGLAPLAAREVFALIADMRKTGVTVLLVEQNVRQALDIADRGYVLESGRIILQGPAQDLLREDILVSSYLGTHQKDGL